MLLNQRHPAGDRFPVGLQLAGHPISLACESCCCCCLLSTTLLPLLPAAAGAQPTPVSAGPAPLLASLAGHISGLAA